MKSEEGHASEKVVLYARAATPEQHNAERSSVPQMEVLRAWARVDGYEVLEEVVDAGQSGATLERPGMERVRSMMATGSPRPC